MFKGVFTAIVTPFDENGYVDFGALRKLIENNIDNGVAGIVPCGTTGETPTLSEVEWEHVILTTVEQVDGRVPVIVGCGSYSTYKTIKQSKRAKQLGADALMVVSPYYNKPTQEGLYRHFKSVCENVDHPVMLYNIKGRTGVNVSTDTLMRILQDCPNLVAVKEASGDLEQMKDVIARRNDGFSVLSGDDEMTLDLIKAGGEGVISVVSNIVPQKMVNLVTSSINGYFEKAEEINNELNPLYKAIFIETNPIPIKYMLSLAGKIKESYRLPLCPLSNENKLMVRKVMEKLRII